MSHVCDSRYECVHSKTDSVHGIMRVVQQDQIDVQATDSDSMGVAPQSTTAPL
jgi:predicted RNA-binding protein with PUA-like domain